MKMSAATSVPLTELEPQEYAKEERSEVENMY
jgi:hypothetical protein